MDSMTRLQQDDAEGFDQLASAAFRGTFDDLRSAGLILPLRPKALSGPSMFEGDFDVLYDPRRFAAVLRIALTHARQHGVSLLVEQTAPVKKRISFLSAPSSRRILLELWPQADILPPGGGDRPLSVSWRAIEPHIVQARTASAALPVETEAAFYLAHLHHKRKSLASEEVQARLAYYRAGLTALASPTAAGLVAAIDALIGGRIDLVEASRCSAQALTQLRLSPRRSWHDDVRLLWRRGMLALRRRMPEPLVPIVGPDGAGKTSITERLTEQASLTTYTFKNAFRYSKLYRALYALFGNASGMQRNLIDERFVQLLLLIARLRWPIIAHRRRKDGPHRPILVDRYFWDYLLKLRDNTRPATRIAGYAFHSWLAPTPHSCVVLVCRLETMLARKQELTSEAVEALYDVYCDQLARAGVGRILIQSTDLPLDATTDCVASFLGDRTRIW